MRARGVMQFVLGMAIAGGLALLALAMSERSSKTTASGFAGSVDMTPLDEAAVNSEGRLKSYASFARDAMSRISGSRRINDQTPDFTYMDLMIRPERYEDVDLIYVKNTTMRARIAELLRKDQAADPARIDKIAKSGLIGEKLLFSPSVKSQIGEWQRDLIRTAKFVDMIDNALSMKDPRAMADRLRLIPPAGDDPKAAWLSVNDLFPAGEDDPATPGVDESLTTPSDVLDPVKRGAVRATYLELVEAWRGENAAKVNEAVRTLAASLAAVNPAVYPSHTQLRWESLYFKLGNLTWGWLLYLVSVIFLLMAVIYRWDGARRIGLGAFTVAFLFHTAALGLRWYVSGRWPNSNMFEAVTTSVWLGTTLAIGIEWMARRTQLRNLFVLAGGVASMAGLMSARYIPQLDSSIRNMMPVLHDLWLYIHTNVIIASYALIAMAAITAVLYLAWRVVGRGGAVYARAGGTAMLVDSGGKQAATGLSPGEILDGATMVLMELSFVLLWAGLVMGAIWADHSWGRPWGWDPKEVFALNTFLVFLVLVHVRLKVADKGLWTAILAVVGCGVMLFNWIVINFIISGLHSYA